VKFFELNPRLGRNHYYLTAAGHNAARFYVREYLGEEYDAGAAGPAPAAGRTLQVLHREVLYTVLPVGLLRRHLRGPVGEKAARLIREGKVFNPLRYRAERHPRRVLYVALNALNQYRKYRQHPPRHA
jgi:D-aspartate ligase